VEWELHVFLTSPLQMEGNGQVHYTAGLLPKGEALSTYRAGNWVDPRAGLAKRKAVYILADHSPPSNVEAIPPLPQYASMAWCSVER
jgi:hypothetical protein